MKDFSADRLFIFAMLMCAFFVSGGVVMLNEGDIGVGVGFCFFGVLFAAVPAVLMPFGYVFDSDGITLWYFFLPNERYLWRNICLPSCSIRIVRYCLN